MLHHLEVVWRISELRVWQCRVDGDRRSRADLYPDAVMPASSRRPAAR
jgi:hypothetical protein